MPNFTYNTNIPAAANNPSSDQPNMQTNTNSINSILSVDMIGFGNTNGGFHSKVTFVDQGSGPGSSASQLVLYDKLVSGVSQLFFQRDGVATEIQLTGGTPTAATSGTTFLPGGIVLQWGSGSLTSAPTTFNSAFPTACFAVVITGSSNSYDGGFVAKSLTTTSFIANRTSGSGNTGFYYIAIGN